MSDKENLPDEFWTDADVRMPDDGDTFAVQMNAEQLRMYLAAPELLQALEEIRDILWSRPDISDRLRPLMGFAEEATNQKAAAAIAKAKGETQ